MSPNKASFLTATNRAGRFVVVPHNWKTIFPHILAELKVYDTKHIIKLDSPNPPLLWIERQAGGYGDIIHALSAIEDKITEFRTMYPKSRVMLGVPTRHEFLVRQLDVDELILTDNIDLTEHKNITEEMFFQAREHVQLLCPCDDHEVETKYDVKKSRVEIFYETCGVKSPVRSPKLKLFNRNKNPFPTDKKVIGVGLRSIDKYKDWSLDRWYKVCKGLQKMGYFVVTFDKEDRFDGVPALTATTMEDVTNHLSWCDLVISPDTAPLFIASAMGVHTIGLFGKTSGYYLLMKNYLNAWSIQINRPDKCKRPCYGSEERGFYCEYAGFKEPSTACMHDIQPSHVLGMVDFLESRTDFGSARFDRNKNFYSQIGKKELC